MSEPVRDSSVIVCKGCGEKKTRYLAGLYPRKKDKKWVDENGFQYNGSYCPDCHRKNVAERKRKKKTNEKR
jgi:hypothetical protein